MPKAVLVMDMPESCKKCVFCRGLNACKLNKYLVGDRICTIYTVDKQIMEGGKPDWCPLRELPEKKEEFEQRECIGSTKGTWEVPLIENKGWNACLDAIAKE